VISKTSAAQILFCAADYSEATVVKKIKGLYIYIPPLTLNDEQQFTTEVTY